MAAAGLVVESSKGECNLGQHEINFLYGEALKAADEHVIYKNGTKEIAAQDEHSITFMAKYNEREGNSLPHPLFAGSGRRRQERLRRRPGDVRPLRRRPARLPARDDADVRALHQLLQALHGGLVRPDRGCLGPRQPHLLGPGRRPRRIAADGEPPAGRGCQSIFGLERDDRLRTARDRRRAAARGPR